MARHKIIIERRLTKRLADSAVRAQVRHCTDLSLKGGRGRGWTARVAACEAKSDRNGHVVYTAAISYSTTSKRESLEAKWPQIVERFADAGCAGQFKASPWKVIEPTGFGHHAEAAKNKAAKQQKLRELADTPKELAPINLKANGSFDRIYGREAQIRRTFDALHLAVKTDWSRRRHTLYDGSPGCGKTETALAFAKMLGNEGEHWLWFDAPNMTKAGAVELLISSPSVPPVLFIEEIEKVEENALRWLLGVMDVRGEVRRTNYRVGNEAKNVRMLIIATANDVKQLKTVMSGALYSRFQNRIYFPEPDREIMGRILAREIREIGGNEKCIEAALKFGYDRWGMRDPRDLINVATCGGDRLLDGTAQADHENTMHPFDRVSLYRAKKSREKQARRMARITEELNRG